MDGPYQNSQRFSVPQIKFQLLEHLQYIYLAFKFSSICDYYLTLADVVINSSSKVTSVLILKGAVDTVNFCLDLTDWSLCK